MQLARALLVMLAVFAMVAVPAAMRARADASQAAGHHHMHGAGMPAADGTMHHAMAKVPSSGHAHPAHTGKCCVSACCAPAVAGHAVIFVAGASTWRLLRHPLPPGDRSPATTTYGPPLRPPSRSASI